MPICIAICDVLKSDGANKFLLETIKLKVQQLSIFALAAGFGLFGPLII